MSVSQVRGTGWFVGSDPPPVLIPGQVTGDLYFDQSNGDLGDPGMKLAEAFSAFSAEVNATPANALVPLSLIKDHSAATGAITYGYVWRLGHPQTPVLLSFTNSSKVQGYNSSSSSARLQLGLESAFTNDSSNGGYGSFSATLFSVNAGLSHYARVAVACIEGRRKNAPTRADLAAGSWPPVAERIGRSPWP